MSENGLYLKLARVMANVGNIEKAGKNQFFNYKYTTADDAYSAIRAALSGEGLAFVASMTEVQQTETGQTDKGGNPVVRTLATFEYTFIDPETGEFKTCLWTGEATDSQDKGVSKASTSALKYFLLKTFIISTEHDDPDGSAGYKPKQNTSPRLDEPRPDRLDTSAQSGTHTEKPATARGATSTRVERPFLIVDDLVKWLQAEAKTIKGKDTVIDAGMAANIAMEMGKFISGKDQRHFLLWLAWEVKTSKELTDKQFNTCKLWLDAKTATLEHEAKLVEAAYAQAVEQERAN